MKHKKTEKTKKIKKKTYWECNKQFIQGISAFFASIILIGAGFAIFQPMVSRAALDPECFTIGCGVGGVYAPGPIPPAGNSDIFTVDPLCGMLVTIVGPYGSDWGTYVWAMPLIEPSPPLTGPPYDYWNQAYITNGPVYTHAGLTMIGYAIPNPDYLCAEFPLLIEQGDSEFKFGF